MVQWEECGHRLAMCEQDPSQSVQLQIGSVVVFQAGKMTFPKQATLLLIDSVMRR